MGGATTGQRRRRVLVWRVTEHCNLGCHFCGYGVATRDWRVEADPLEVARLGRLLAAWRSDTGRDVLVAWLGGEPFLWKPIDALSRQFHESGILLSATTNGLSLAAPRVRDLVIDCFAEIVVSVDGLAHQHDHSRARLGLYDDVKSAVCALRDERDRRGAPLKITANTIVMRDNMRDFDALCGELSSWGIEELTFNALGGHDRPAFYADHHLTSDHVSSFAAELADVRRRRPLHILGSERYVDRLRARAKGERRPVDDCDPGAWFWFVTERGTIAPCSGTADTYGVLTSSLSSVADVDAVEGRFRAARARERAAPCNDCPSTQHWGKFDAAAGADTEAAREAAE